MRKKTDQKKDDDGKEEEKKVRISSKQNPKSEFKIFRFLSVGAILWTILFSERHACMGVSEREIV